MKNSFKKLAESLHFDPEETSALRSATRSWLEGTYYNDDNKISRLGRSEIRKQAHDFLHKHGVAFFSKVERGRMIWGLSSDRDDALITKLTFMMACQTEYKGREIRARNRQDHARSPTEFDLSESVSSDCDSQEDESYTPSNMMLQSPLLKTHNTRLNGQPEKRALRSIETDLPPIRNTENTADTIDVAIEKRSEGGPRAGGVLTPHGKRKAQSADIPVQSVRRRTDAPVNPSSRYSTVRGRLDKHDIAKNASTYVLPRQAVQTTQHIVEPLELPLTRPKSLHRSPMLQRPVIGGLFLDLDQIDSDEEEDNYYTGASSHLPSRTPLAYIDQPGMSRCEQTPPASDRSISDLLNSIGRCPTEDDRKPHVIDVKPTIVDLTQADEDKIWLGSDYFVVIKKTQALQILQAVLDAIDDKSRGCRKLAQRTSGSLAYRRSAEEKAVFMSQWIGELKANKDIWAGNQGRDETIEIG